MYDIERLRALLPYCTKIDIEAHEDKATGERAVYVICHYTNGLEVRARCPGMPVDTQAMADIVVAGACQALAAVVQEAVFTYRKNVRHVKRDGGDGKPWADGKPIPFCAVPDAPQLRQVKLTQPDVIDVDGQAVTSSDPVQKTDSLLSASKGRVNALLLSSSEKLDKEKASKAFDAMKRLIAATGGDDG